MTTSRQSSTATTDEDDAPSLGELLLQSAGSARDRTAVQALIEEEDILARDNIRAALVVKADGVMTCRWEGLSGRVYTLGLDEGERAFLSLVLSLVGVRQTSLACVEGLDDRRLKIVLRAILRLSSNNSIAVGTRI